MDVIARGPITPVQTENPLQLLTNIDIWRKIQQTNNCPYLQISPLEMDHRVPDGSEKADK